MWQKHTSSSVDQAFLAFALFFSVNTWGLNYLNKQKTFPFLSPPLPTPPSAGCAPPPPAHKWPHTRQDGGKAPNYSSLLMRRHSGEGSEAGHRTASRCRLLPVAQNGEQRSWVICWEGANASPPHDMGCHGGWALLVCPTTTLGKGGREDPQGPQLFLAASGWGELCVCGSLTTAPSHGGGCRDLCCSWSSRRWDAFSCGPWWDTLCLNFLPANWGVP